MELAPNLVKIDKEDSESDEALEAIQDIRPNVEEYWIKGKLYRTGQTMRMNLHARQISTPTLLKAIKKR